MFRKPVPCELLNFRVDETNFMTSPIVITGDSEFLKFAFGKVCRHFLLAVAAASLAGCATKPLPTRTVAYVDLNRYLGKWYVIANIPYWLEQGKVASFDTYSMRPDGRMNNIFTFRKSSLDAPQTSWRGVAWVVNHESNAEWRVRFLWPFYSTYLVLALDPQYQWAVVATPGHKLLWVLARERHLDETTYSKILQLIAAQGYDTNRLHPVPQPATN